MELSRPANISVDRKDGLTLPYFAAMAALLVILLSSAYARNGVWENEMRIGADIVGKNPRSARAWANLGIAYLKQDRITDAIAASNRSLRLIPNGVAHNTLGDIYVKLGRDDEAIEQYTRAIELDTRSTAAIYNNRGIVYFHKGDFDRAIDDYTRALALRPRFMLAYMNRGNALDEKGLTAAALEDYNRAIELDPDYAEAYRNRGIALKAGGRLSEARRDLESACSRGSWRACGALMAP